MFVGKARGYYLGRPSLVHKHFSRTRLERLAKDKHCSLLQKSVNYGRNEFYSTGPTIFALPNFVKKEFKPLDQSLRDMIIDPSVQ